MKIPAHILNLPRLGLNEKVLLAHFYSFGAKGCWQSNQTLAEIFMVSRDTISRWIAKIRPFIYLKNPKGYYRTIWAKSHPAVADYSKNAEGPRQYSKFEFGKSMIRLRQKCRTTNNNTITENKRITIASPAPLPAGGQAPATLTERQKEARQRIEQFKRNFCKGKASQWQPLTEEQFEKRRAQQLAALRAVECLACSS